MTAQAISWIWWNSITGRIASPTCAAGNSTPAIGTPAARLFFDPQNSSTIASPRGSRSAFAAYQVTASTTASSTAHRASSIARSPPVTRRHSPSATAAPNAV